MELRDKIILVTGSSSGIGRAIAIECAQAGAITLIHYRKNQVGAKETLKQINKYSQGKIYQADLSISSEATKLFENLQKDFKLIDALVNNAGESRGGSLDNIPMWEHQLQNILMSMVYTTNEFLKLQNQASLRKIINISSIYGDLNMGNPEFIQYSGAKAAVNSLTYNLAKKLAPQILVNAVAPGYTWTPPWGASQAAFKDEINLTRIKRFITPEEIATTVVGLLGNDAITGEIIRVDGGLHLQDIL